MSLLKQEIDINYRTFFGNWTAQADSNWQHFSGEEVLVEGYRRVCSLNAWKVQVISAKLSKESQLFYNEAHNDALVSQVNASMGAWRTSLQALRGLIENMLCALYYKDHPIELQLWENGEFKIGFSDLHAYFLKHPLIRPLDLEVTGLPTIKKEYATLSRAVHGSAADFRMTTSATETLLWNQDLAKLRMWASRQKATVEALNLLLICLFRDELTGTKATALREILYFSVSATKRRLVKQDLRVTIQIPS